MCWEVEAEVLLLKMRNKKKLNCWWKGLKTKLLFLKFTSILVKKELVVHKMNHVLNEAWNSRLHSVELRCELFNQDEEVRVKTDFISDLISLLSSIYSSREEPFMSKSFSEKINKSIYMRCRWSGCRRRRGGVGHSSCQLRYVFTTITFIIWNFFSAFVQQDQQKQSCQLPQTHSGCFTDGWMEERLNPNKLLFWLSLMSQESRKRFLVPREISPRVTFTVVSRSAERLLAAAAARRRRRRPHRFMKLKRSQELEKHKSPLSVPAAWPL